jgi:hypothetical protein
MSPFVSHRGQKSISISAYANEEHRIVAARKHRLTERPLVGEPMVTAAAPWLLAPMALGE